MTYRQRLYPVVLAAALSCVGCVGALQGGMISTSKPVQVPVYSFGIVACSVPVATTAHCPAPIAGATIQVNGTSGYVSKPADADGWALFTSIIPFSDVKISASGYVDFAVGIEPPKIDQQNVTFSLQPLFPRPPTRDQVLNVRLTFQGLVAHTQQFGDLPWFEAALPWLTLADRELVYAAKRASTAWPGGDTHCIVALPGGGALYPEPGQPYDQPGFGPLDWTAGNTAIDPQFVALVAEVIQHGFVPMVFLGGDDGETGYTIAVKQLPLVIDALQHAPQGDLTKYAVIIPGWDGVFYGYTPEHIHAFGLFFRSLLPDGYLGLEHSTGHIPAGEGPGEWWAPNGPMRPYDLVLSEFNDGQFDGTVWQIAARLLGQAYVWPPDEPVGSDVRPAPNYLRDGSDRGPIVNCAFEFGEYTFVHRGTPPALIDTWRTYFKNIGYTCGG